MAIGAVLTFTNGGWLAVRYRDTHYNRVRSSAVAKSSDGRYLESHRHFCGTIQGLGRRAKEWQNSDAEYHEFWLSTWRDSGHSRNTNSVPTGLDLLPLLEASNLDAAIQALRALGFRDVPP